MNRVLAEYYASLPPYVPPQIDKDEPNDDIRESCFQELDADRVRHEMMMGERDQRGNKTKECGI